MTILRINENENKQLTRIADLKKGEFFEMEGKLFYTTLIFENTKNLQAICFNDKTLHFLNPATQNYEVILIKEVDIKYQ